MKYKSIFISDVHVGLKYSRVKDLIEFLKNNECETLYLVGDIIDGWALGRKWYWNEDCNLLVQKILRKSRKGIKVIYLPGNHDEFLRSFGDSLDLGNIEIKNEVIHTSPNGKKYLVIHGDVFDGILSSMRFISYIGSMAYDVILKMNSILNKVRSLLGLEYWSLSHHIKINTKEAVKFCVKFEETLTDIAKSKNVDGVICGHIHYPCQKTINGIEYHNTGCWIELATAIVEYDDGRLELIDLDKKI